MQTRDCYIPVMPSCSDSKAGVACKTRLSLTPRRFLIQHVCTTSTHNLGHWLCVGDRGNCPHCQKCNHIPHSTACQSVSFVKSELHKKTLITTTILWPFFWDHLGEPVPEENFWTLWCKGRLTEADTLTIRLGATPSGLTSAYLHHPPIFLQSGCLTCCPANSIKALKATSALKTFINRVLFSECY